MSSLLANGRVEIRVGDCRDLLREMPEASVDACVTDPPYHLTSIVKRFGGKDAAPAKVGATGAYARASRGFMGQTWDGGDVAFDSATWAEVWRVLKPGAHLIAFGGTRTYHRIACAIEDAGFEVRDGFAWLYGSGFPKSHNLSGEWEGWGTALKPAWEPAILARKPLIGTVAANVLAHGTGALNIDASRVAGGGGAARENEPSMSRRYADRGATNFAATPGPRGGSPAGRWPANVIHDGSDAVIGALPEAPGQMATVTGEEASSPFANVYGEMPNRAGRAEPRGDAGSAARFFYCAKPSRDERGPENTHPTVKPAALMAHLVQMVTPPGGLVLDPFSGSGTTGLAAARFGFRAILMEQSEDYAAIARARIARDWREPKRADDAAPVDLGPLFSGAAE